MIKEKNILIIGGSSGIGLALAEILSPLNSVYIASRSSENLINIKATHIPYDATTQNLEISSLPDTIDGFVYCPGSINLRPFKGLSSEAFENRSFFSGSCCVDTSSPAYHCKSCEHNFGKIDLSVFLDE